MLAGCTITRAPDIGASAGATGPSGPAGRDAQTSGTRLRARYYTAPDGTRVFKSMYDVLLNKSVAPSIAADGVLRWIPNEMNASCAYFKAGCTQRICWKVDGTCYAQGVWTANLSQCDAGETHVMAFGAIVPDNTPTFERDAVGNCVAAGDTGLAGMHFEAGPEIEPTTYIEASIVAD